MDQDVQQQYLAAEQAYGEGDFDQAEAIASALLRRLDSPTSSSTEQEACLAWRSFVALLLGHIYFHGLHQAEKAEAHYQLVLASQPPDILRDLAQQGVKRCRDWAEQGASEAPRPGGTTAPVDHSLMNTAPPSDALGHDTIVDSMPMLDPTLIRDPFLSTASDVADPTPSAQASATPWLHAEGMAPNDGSGMASIPASAGQTITTDLDGDGPRPPLTETTTDVDTERINAETDDNVKSKDPTENPPDAKPLATIEEPGSEQPPAAAEPIDLSPWLLRRTITFNKR